jgi:hypothetical protein
VSSSPSRSSQGRWFPGKKAVEIALDALVEGARANRYPLPNSLSADAESLAWVRWVWIHIPQGDRREYLLMDTCGG